MRRPMVVRQRPNSTAERRILGIGIAAVTVVAPVVGVAESAPSCASASAHKVQPKPAAGRCHARRTGLHVFPDRS